MKKICSLFLITFLLQADSNLNIRHVTIADIVYQPHTEEGYLQGWNFFFRNSEYNIIATFLVSNLGPNDFNNGVSIAIESKKTGSLFITKEFGQKDLNVENGINLKMYNNTLKYESGKFELSQYYDDIKIFLKFESDGLGATLSGGKHFVKGNDKFVRADIPFSFVRATGYLDFKGEIVELVGVGGLEHLITNYEVYKYSSKWEILRASNKEGMKLYTGGFHGIKKNADDFFRTIVIQNPKGEIILSGIVTKSEIISSELDKFSGYVLPIKEKIYIGDNGCYVQSERLYSVGKINILSNISAVLRFFIKLIFANPYQVNFLTKLNVVCNDSLKISTSDFIGIHSYYLINPK
ncbi:MAG TPA: hypothetical protein PK079_01600 [Leptospiraceae bacterium]|nr:hypothetical protein [Leptospiraceae bacterium]HMX32808.1 hypothetical protein [Leptospiraceae bacterium]HMY33541.1 hypothetical protein [Leptospiraceae bacterium]HMZ66797.1 hypothetical protein [Leptospiraceae bacterium]HNA09626.1 hypothetical protein [Leptospiraceae bacterium]